MTWKQFQRKWTWKGAVRLDCVAWKTAEKYLGDNETTTQKIMDWVQEYKTPLLCIGIGMILGGILVASLSSSCGY